MADRIINSNQTTLSKRFPHTALPETIFPLLCPVMEYDWIPTWDCEMHHSRSGCIERGCVFGTHLLNYPPETWVTFRYEPPVGVGFVRVSTDVTIIYDITLTPLGNDECASTWTMALTPLSNAGRELVAMLAGGGYEQQMTMFMELLDAHLAKIQAA